PLAVAPPLSPEKAMHGGEYGSPGTCSSRSGQPPAAPGGTTSPPPPAPPSPPSPPPPPVSSTPSGVVTMVSGPSSSASLSLADPVATPGRSPPSLVASWVSSCTFDGTRTDMSSSIPASTASGP